MTGRGGNSGAWQIRSEQLGKAIGATIMPNALDVAAFDLAVLVKRTPGDLVQRLHRAGVPIVYDVVDGWPQPEGNAWDRDQCMSWLRAQVAHIKPAGIVAATKCMAVDCAEFDLPILTLPHHARPELARTPIRPLAVVGYEGSAEHLGSWRPKLERICAARGLEFRINPPNINDVDVLVALREVSGYAPSHWKSNVKLANAQASGTPIICAREAGYMETATGGVFWAKSESEVSAALDALTPVDVRCAAAADLAQARTSIDDVAADYLTWLRGLQ